MVVINYSGYDFEFNEEKDLILRTERNISFRKVIDIINDGKCNVITDHPNLKKYPRQFIYEINIEGYMYVVPAVKSGNKIFLKTIYPSRKATKKYRRSNYEKND